MSGVSVAFIIPYVSVIAASLYCSYVYSKRDLLFWENKNDSELYVKGGMFTYLLYVGALIARIIISFLFYGYQIYKFDSHGNIFVVNKPLLYAGPDVMIISLMIADLLLAIGVGMLMGRSMRIIDYYYSRHKSDINIK